MWTELGIAPTSDAGAIRKAYADRLRAVTRSGDREAFQRLRSAYERAVAYAQRRPAPQADLAALQVERPQAEPAPTQAPQAPPEKSEAQLLLDQIGAALKARDLDQALKLYDHGLAMGLIPLGWQDQLLDQIMQGPVSDPGIGPEAYIALMRRVGWSAEQLGQRVSRVRAAAMARLNAERWLMEQVQTARGGESIWRLLRGTFVLKWPVALDRWVERWRNARLLVRGSWQLPRVMGAGIKDLRKRLALYHLHKDWLAGKIPEGNVARVQACLDAEDAWRIFRYAVATLIAVPLMIAMCLTGGGIIGAFFLGRFLLQMYNRKQ